MGYGIRRASPLAGGLLSANSVEKVIVGRHFLVIEMLLRGATDDGSIATRAE
jgi:hypothetical protein